MSVKSKVEGKGNDIRTVVVNAKELGDVYNRDPDMIVDYIASRIGAPVVSGKIVGEHDTHILQMIMDEFTDKCVMCHKCKRFESTMSLGDKGMSYYVDCLVCGDRRLEMTERIFMRSLRKRLRRSVH